MILMGDEVRRTQGGNNNAYCLDDETSWFDWTLLARHADVHRFVRLNLARRLLRPSVPVSLNQLLTGAEKAWHGVKLNRPDWSEHSHSMAVAAEVRAEGLVFHFILNAHWEALEFELPRLTGGTRWRRWIDTGLDSPDDIVDWQAAPPHHGSSYRAEARSVVMLFAEGASFETVHP
jgi:glycogen operon protein